MTQEALDLEVAEPVAEPKGAAPSRRPWSPPRFQVFSVSTRYARTDVLGYSRTFDRAVAREGLLAGAIAKALREAIESGEGLEVVRVR